MIRVDDPNVAFIQPDDILSGHLGSFLNKSQNGIYALVWHVADEVQARSHFAKLALRQTQEGCVSSGFAIDPDDFLGARHEFVTASD